jgi:2,4-dienoyl-CoA reductase-like NADH-dependent reductase (Old Yellow Enzyme family)
MMGYTSQSTPQAPKSERTAAREAYFLEFAKGVRQRHPELILMLTGGFRSRAGAEAAIQDNACDLIGIARPAAVDPKWPLKLLDESMPDDKVQLALNKAPVPFFARWLPRFLIGAGAETVSFS